MNSTTRARSLGISLSAAFGATGVILGAFGAHALRARLAPELLDIYKTGVLYHLLHAVAMLGSTSIVDRLRWPRATLALFATGVVIFSGSLYLLAVTGTRALGAITPLGGLALIAAWISVAMVRPLPQQDP
jgi:uncharacterized membrane protein YgdD (TMEM256/DUF423 family)